MSQKRQKKSENWSMDREETLIEFYKEHPVLYKTKGCKGSTKQEKANLKLILIDALDKKFSGK